MDSYGNYGNSKLFDVRWQIKTELIDKFIKRIYMVYDQ